MLFSFILNTRDAFHLIGSGIVGFIVGGFVGKFGERRTLVKDIGDRYIAAAQADPSHQDDEFQRLGTLQKSGAAQLNQRELSRVCRRIVAHGLRDPQQREISTVFTDERSSLHGLLHWAAQNSFDLSDSTALMRRHCEELDAAKIPLS